MPAPKQTSKKKEIESINHQLINKMSFFINDISFRGLHAHKDVEVLILLSGTMHIETPDEEFLMAEGSAAYFNPAQPHACQSTCADPCRLLVLQFDPSFCIEYFPSMRNLFFETADLARTLSPDQMQEFKAICYRAATNYFIQSTGFVFKCISDLNLIMDRMLNHVPYLMIPEDSYLSAANFEKRLSRIISYIQDHYSEKISLQDIADRENLTTSYLSHLLKDHLLKSFQAFVNELRFERAVFLLKNTNLKIIDVCIESGFSDSKYLNRAFMDVFGMTPKEYRKQAKEHPAEASIPDNNVNEYIYDRESSLQIISSL